MSDTDANAGDGTAVQPSSRSFDVRTSLQWAALAGLVLLAFVAAVQFYLNGGRAIRIWVAPEYEPLFQAAFNLVLLLVAGLGISWLVRRLNG